MEQTLSYALPDQPRVLSYLYRLLFKGDADLLTIMGELQRDYGDVVKIKLPFLEPTWLVMDPDIIGRVLVGTEKIAKKPRFQDRLKKLVGAGILTNGGETWRFGRRLVNPAFHPRMIEQAAGIVWEETQKMADEWDAKIQTQPVINLTEEFTRLTFTIIVRILFTVNLGCRSGEMNAALNEIQNCFGMMLFSPVMLPLAVPIPIHRRLKRAIRTLDSITYEIISQHEAQPELYQDLLSSLMKAKDPETGGALSRRQLRDELVNLIAAGHETTTSTLTMGLEALSHQPHVIEAMRDEYKRGIGPHAHASLTYTHQVSLEIMRLYPAVWILGRELLEDLQVKSHFIPKGSNVVMPQYRVHRHPEYWQEPDRFNPDRFAADGPGYHPFAYFPFGAGGRNCVGMNLAKMEMAVILSQLIDRFDFLPVPGFQFKLKPRVTLTPDPQLLIQVRRRSRAS